MIQLSHVLLEASEPSPDPSPLAPRPPPGAAEMANRTTTSTPYYSYEYYLDYLDLIPVDEKKLKANKHLIVIAFWVSLAAFVVLLFLILLYMPWSGSPQLRNNPQHHPTCPWSHILNLPLCFRRHLTRPGGPLGARQAPSPLGGPGSRGSASDQQLGGQGPPAPLRPTLLSSGNWPTPGPLVASADSRNQPGSLPETEPLNCRIDTTKSQPGLRGPVKPSQAGHTRVFSKPVYV